MSDVKSKNLYELLGNDHDQDSDKEPEPPTKAVDKTQGRSGKREAPKEKTEQAPPRPRDDNRRRGGFTGNERAFRDNPTGRRYNRDQPTEGGDGTVKGRDSGPGTQRGGRGQRGPRRGGDRHINRSGKDEHAKQADQAWGQPTGDGEWTDEKAGEAIAQQEVKEGGFDAGDVPPPVDGEGNTPADDREPEPVDNSKSYADYLAEKAQQKLEGLGLKEARAPNEGSKENKKWKSAKELTKSKEEEEAYFVGEAKAKRERERAAKKEFIDIDYSFKEQPRDAGRGRGRGGRARGERGGERGDRGGGDRGDRADRGDRTDRADRGGERGGRGEYRGRRGDDRGSFRGRGGRGGGGDSSIPVNDQKAFPSLGGN